MKKQFNRSIGLIIVIICSFLFGAFTYKWVADTLTPDDIKGAAKVIGLEMTDKEIDMMKEGLEENLEIYQSYRENPLDNSVVPAMMFNPLPTGYEMEGEQKKVRFSKVKVEMPANKDDLAFYTVRQLAELIRTKKISSLELTEFFIDRLKNYDQQLECIITLTEERALAMAKKADREIQSGNYKGLLHGIPYGAKDLLAVSGYKTTWGAMPYKEQTIDYDASVIQQLDEAGAVLVAKLTLGALAMGDYWYGGRTRNPWNTEQGSSGSSAGSASAVAAGLVPFALGTETLGSIVSPSTRCGTTGLRPTYGRVSRHGAMALVWSMDKIGPICRSAEDCAIVFNSIYGTDGKDPMLMDAPFNYDDRKDPKTIKIGYTQKDFERNYGFKAQDSLTLLKLKELGIELIPIELPEFPNIGIILSAESAAAFDELTVSGQDDLLVRQRANSWPNIFRQARFIPAVEYIQANRKRSQLIEEMTKVFEQVDVYIHPSWGSSSLRITNYTGHPCVVLPNGFRNGTPTSISITGKLFGEADVLTVAKLFQDATDFDDKHPEL